MTRSALIAAVAQDTGLPEATIRRALASILKTLSDALVDGERVTLTGFGTFERAWRPPRRGRHPGTGRLYQAHPRFALSFKAGQPLRRRLRALIPRFQDAPEHVRARRIALTMVADLRLYHGHLLAGSAEGEEELRGLVSDLRDRFAERVPKEVTQARHYLEEELSGALQNHPDLALRPTS